MRVGDVNDGEFDRGSDVGHVDDVLLLRRREERKEYAEMMMGRYTTGGYRTSPIVASSISNLGPFVLGEFRYLIYLIP